MEWCSIGIVGGLNVCACCVYELSLGLSEVSTYYSGHVKACFLVDSDIMDNYAIAIEHGSLCLTMASTEGGDQ